jgi:hypothetical protein
MICTWLGLPSDAWPPDHYRLLGLTPGEGDVSLIDQRVHQKLDLVRPYQMLHPEQATEAMNRLAQAFICLTDPVTKRAYDLSLLGPRARPEPPQAPPPPVLPSVLPASVPPPPPPPPPPPAPVPFVPRDPLVWLYTPGMAGPAGEVPLPPVRLSPGPQAPVLEAPPPPVLPPAPPPEPVDTVVEAAQTSPAVRRGLATKRALYNRIARTRELLRLWQRVGKHLDDAEKRLGKQEAGELYKLVRQVEDKLEDFPLLGEAGQPGYMIVSLTQLEKARALQGLNTSQRESLSRDWKAGRKFLEAHQVYLRAELRAHRRRSWAGRMLRTVRAFFNEEPLAAWALVVALFVVVVALWRDFLMMR